MRTDLISTVSRYREHLLGLRRAREVLLALDVAPYLNAHLQRDSEWARVRRLFPSDYWSHWDVLEDEEGMWLTLRRPPARGTIDHEIKVSLQDVSDWVRTRSSSI